MDPTPEMDLREKASHLLYDLQRVAAATQEERESPRHHDPVIRALSTATEDAVELCSAVCGKHLSRSHVERYAAKLLDGQRDAVEEVAHGIGLLSETSAQRKHREFAELLLEVERAATLTRAEGRTKIWELLLPYENDSRPLDAGTN